jgi:arylsulfatase A-like enzyme
MNSKKASRRSFIKQLSIGVSTLSLPTILAKSLPQAEQPKPNILWITSEDNGPFLGCYGDKFAITPNLDKLAAQGILYENAFATAPVCAPARCSIITGVYPPALGTQHMRSYYAVPDKIKYYPEYLRSAGYYCTNNKKTDYNTDRDYQHVWEGCSEKAHYKNRQSDQPFFAIFNITSTHESSIHKTEKYIRHDPEKITLPPYHPDTPEIRHDWAQYYDKIEDMDKQVGGLLTELEEYNLSQNTIVFYYSDHGGVLARSKRFCYDSGLRVPFIVRFPKKYQHLAPATPGSRLDRIITFTDLAPTLLSLAGIMIPKYMQGKAFLGKHTIQPRKYAFSFRGRMDERYDMSRTIRDKRFRYIRNYNPHLIYGQYLEYLWRAPATQSWERMYNEGGCNEIQSAFWQPKPVEELYDCLNDSWEVNNLAGNPQYRTLLEKMRDALRQYMLEIYDCGFIPEGEMVEISKKQPIYEFVRSAKYDLKRIMDTADIAISHDASFLPVLIKRLYDPDTIIRFWAATGCLILGEKAKTAHEDLRKLLHDKSGDVRAVASEALCQMDLEKEALPILIDLLSHANVKVALRSANALNNIGDKAKPVLGALEQIKNKDDKYIKRAVRYLLNKLE